MSWYKEAAPAVYKDKHIPRSSHKHDVPVKRAERFFNYLMKKGTKHTFYHGTATAILGKVFDNGMLYSPKALSGKVPQREPRTHGQDQIFFAATEAGTSHYHKRAFAQTESTGVILQLEIPLYAITEIRHAILNPFQQHPAQLYNESGHHQTMSNIIQGALKQIKSRKQEAEAFANLEKKIKQTLDSITYGDEWTTAHAVPIRFIKEIKYGSHNYTKTTSLSDYKTASALNAKLAKDKEARDKVKKELAKNPSDFALLSGKFRKSKTVQSIVAKAWAKKLKKKFSSGYNNEENRVLEWIPNELMNHAALKEALNGETCPDCKGTGKVESPEGPAMCPKCKGNKTIGGIMDKIWERAEKMQNWYDIDSFIRTMPGPITMRPEIVHRIKKVIYTTTMGSAEEAFHTIKLMPPAYYTSDMEFANFLVDNVYAKLGDYYYTDYWGEVPPFFKSIPKLFSIYFSKMGNPFAIAYNTFSSTVLESNKELIQQRLVDYVAKHNMMYVFDYLHNIPEMFLTPQLKEKMIEHVLKMINGNNANLMNFLAYYKKLPKYLQDEKVIHDTVLQQLSAKDHSWEVWCRVPEEIQNLPQFKSKVEAAKLMYNGVSSVKYDTLSPDLKGAYAIQLIKEIEGNPTVYENYCPDELKKNPDVLQALAKGWSFYIRHGYVSQIPQEVMNNPDLSAYKKIMYEGILASDYTSLEDINYDELPPELHKLYLEKVIQKLKTGNFSVEKVPPQLMQGPTEEKMYEAAADGINYQLMYNGNISEGIMAVLNNPKFSKYAPKIKETVINHYKARLNDKKGYHYVWDTMENMPSEAFSVPEMIPMVIEALKSANFYDVHNSKYYHDRVIEAIDSKALEEPLKVQLKAAANEGYVNYMRQQITSQPVYYQYVHDKELKKQLEPAAKQALIDLVDSKDRQLHYRFDSLYQAKQMFPKDPVFKALEEKLIVDAVKFISKETGMQKKHVCDRCKAYTKDPRIIEACTPNLDKEIEQVLAEKNFMDKLARYYNIVYVMGDTDPKLKKLKEQLGVEAANYIKQTEKTNIEKKQTECNRCRQYLGYSEKALEEACQFVPEEWIITIEKLEKQGYGIWDKSTQLKSALKNFPDNPKLLQFRKKFAKEWVTTLKGGYSQSTLNIYWKDIILPTKMYEDEPSLAEACGKQAPAPVAPVAPPAQPVAPAQPAAVNPFDAAVQKQKKPTKPKTPKKVVENPPQTEQEATE